MLRRSVLALRLLAAGSLACAGAACGVDDGASAGHVDVAVQPRVVLDGTIELSDRTAGRVVIDEVIAHAPLAIVKRAGADFGEVVVDGDDPLLFRYALADRTGFGAALANKNGETERLWAVPVNGATVDVAFGAADRHIALDYGDVHSDVLTGLGGHTLIVHGTIAVESEASAAFGGLVDGERDGEVSDVDPDGGAAEPGRGEVSDVDPDGGAAEPADAESAAESADVEPAGTGEVSDVDPDGGAAEPDPEPAHGGDISDVDPDGGAAEPVQGRPDPAQGGDVKDVDPDGTPAAGTNDPKTSTPADVSRTKRSKALSRTFEGQGRKAVVNVPFSLVTDGSFHRAVTFDGDAVSAVGDGEVLPLDLHLSAADLLDARRLTDLEALARDAVAEDDDAAVVTLPVSETAALTATVKTTGSIRKPHRVVEGSSRIRVSGDLRR